VLTATIHTVVGALGELKIAKNEMEIILLPVCALEGLHLRQVGLSDTGSSSNAFSQQTDRLEVCEGALVSFVVESICRSSEGHFGFMGLVEMAAHHGLQPAAPRLPSTDRIPAASVLKLEGAP